MQAFVCYGNIRNLQAMHRLIILLYFVSSVHSYYPTNVSLPRSTSEDNAKENRYDSRTTSKDISNTIFKKQTGKSNRHRGILLCHLNL